MPQWVPQSLKRRAPGFRLCLIGMLLTTGLGAGRSLAGHIELVCETRDVLCLGGAVEVSGLGGLNRLTGCGSTLKQHVEAVG